jgi:hypothetical protein
MTAGKDDLFSEFVRLLFRREVPIPGVPIREFRT